MHWILSKEPECEEMRALLIEDQLTSEEYMNAQCKSSYLRDKLVISSENVIKTAWMTTGQRENSLWAAVRNNCIKFWASYRSYQEKSANFILEEKVTQCLQS